MTERAPDNSTFNTEGTPFTEEQIEHALAGADNGPYAFMIWRMELRDAAEGNIDAQNFVKAIGKDRMKSLANIGESYIPKDLDWLNSNTEDAEKAKKTL